MTRVLAAAGKNIKNVVGSRCKMSAEIKIAYKELCERLTEMSVSL
ncbi:MAG: hypothetical protein DDT30_00564 [Dehalococcoidia bacterium]|nr:hypothetical protein [Bacillota bacterium]MBT9141869.1 hypothetical protein [Bacillota bacterium]